MRLTIKIELDNAAFEYERENEIARILSDLSDRLPTKGKTRESINLYDYNGNWCGMVVIE